MEGARRPSFPLLFLLSLFPLIKRLLDYPFQNPIERAKVLAPSPLPFLLLSPLQRTQTQRKLAMSFSPPASLLIDNLETHKFNHRNRPVYQPLLSQATSKHSRSVIEMDNIQVTLVQTIVTRVTSTATSSLSQPSESIIWALKYLDKPRTSLSS
jgi:hypothetical protein